jgi:hypothetical protein
MDTQMETSHRPQHETSKGTSNSKQQTNMVTLHFKQTNKN